MNCSAIEARPEVFAVTSAATSGQLPAPDAHGRLCRPINPMQHWQFLPRAIPAANELRASEEPCDGLDRSYSMCGREIQSQWKSSPRCVSVSLHHAGFGSYIEAVAFDSWVAETRGFAPVQMMPSSLLLNGTDKAALLSSTGLASEACRRGMLQCFFRGDARGSASCPARGAAG